MGLFILGVFVGILLSGIAILLGIYKGIKEIKQ